MSAINFADLARHAGHNIEVVEYVDLAGNAANVAAECVDCYEVLLDFDADDEPSEPFTGVPGYETDAWGNEICGHDFMAGTICTDRRGHDGGHSAKCLNCGRDWYDGSCVCPNPYADEDEDEAPATELEILDLVDFAPEPEDETWRKTYSEKPGWWDDPSEPRCDYCGIHCEDAETRSPDSWDGVCGNCSDHCVCSS